MPRGVRKRPVKHLEPTNVVEAFAMLAFGDLPHRKPGRRDSLGLRVAPLSFGFLLIVLAFVLLIVWAIILGPGT